MNFCEWQDAHNTHHKNIMERHGIIMEIWHDT